jgi:hypothetical protein
MTYPFHRIKDELGLIEDLDVRVPAICLAGGDLYRWHG